MSERLVSVAVRVPRLAVDRPFTYLASEGLDVGTGSLVSVPFHGRAVQGWVLGEADEMPARVAEVKKALSAVRFFDERLLALYRWLAERYLTPLSVAIDRGIPPRVVSEERAAIASPGTAALRPGRLADGPLSRYDRGAELLAALDGRAPGAFLVRPLPRDEAAAAIEAVGRVLAAGRSAIVLVPEAEPPPYTARAIRDAFGEAVALFLGGEPRERYRTWLDILGGRHRVVVGTRPAVFSPLRELGLIWVAREAHAGHREERSPSYHVRDVAVARARIEGAVAVAAALCPSTEAADPASGLTSVRATRSAERAAWAIVETVRPGPEGRAPRLVQLLKRSRGAFLLSSRPGYGVARVCRACGEPAACATCGGVLEQARGKVTCRACGAPGVCANCGASTFGVQRRGAERVLEWARGVSAALVVAADEGPRAEAVAVGTAASVRDAGPMALDLVGILDADRMRRRPGLAGAEQALATWFEAAAWAAPRDRARVVVETVDPGDASVQSLVRSDPWVFLADERARRVEAGFPPGHPVFRMHGAPGLAERLAALDPVSLLSTVAEDEQVCLVTVRPGTLPELAEQVRRWARAGEVRRVEAEPHL